MYELFWDEPYKIERVTFVPVGRGLYAEIDAEDFEKVSKFKWGHWRDGRAKYAGSGKMENGKWVTISMHRLIMGFPKKKVIDHRNNIGLDNRKSNLRVASYSQNCQNRRTQHLNSTGYKGVWRNGAKWSAELH